MTHDRSLDTLGHNYANVCAHVHTDIDTHSHSDTQVHKYANTYMHTQVKACNYTHIRIDTLHTNTHTHEKSIYEHRNISTDQ